MNNLNIGKSIRPGKYIYDDDGKLIQAHGGSVFYADGKFYLYGENKEGVNGRANGGNGSIWHNGVKMYSSTDLYNWKNEGVIALDENDPESPFYPARIMDRPHIVYCEKTKKYVMWAKIAELLTENTSFSNGYYAVCESDKINGKYKLIRKETAGVPGDFDLVVDGEKCYIIYEKPHSEMICTTLSDDFTSFTDQTSSHLPYPYPPFVREAPAFFERNGRKFLLTSGTTGYYPNKSEIAEIIEFHGEWKELGNACRGDIKNNSFHAQFSSVFRHPKKKDLYICLGDRWLVDIPENFGGADKIFESWFNPNAKFRYGADALNGISDENTSLAQYVWLPLKFDENGNPFIEWTNEWKVEDYEDA